MKADDGGPVATTVISTVGLPQGRTALFTSNTGPHAGTVQAYLVPHTQRPITDEEAADKVRAGLRDAIPGVQSYFFVGGIVKRILNFGAAAPIDIEVVGYDLDAGSDYAKRLLPRLRALSAPDGRPMLTDLQISREENYPELDVVVDREKAGMLGVSEQQVAQTVLTSLVGNTQFAPVPFTDPKIGQPVLHQRPAGGRGAQRGLRPRRGAGPRRRRLGAAARQRRAGEALGRPRPGEPEVPPAHRRHHRQHHARRRPRNGQRRGGEGDRGDPAARGLHRPALRPDPGAARGLRQPALRGPDGAGARLHDPGLAVQIAARPAGHHVLAFPWA